jgi:hypothetical protein
MAINIPDFLSQPVMGNPLFGAISHGQQIGAEALKAPGRVGEAVYAPNNAYLQNQILQLQKAGMPTQQLMQSFGWPALLASFLNPDVAKKMLEHYQNALGNTGSTQQVSGYGASGSGQNAASSFGAGQDNSQNADVGTNNTSDNISPSIISKALKAVGGKKKTSDSSTVEGAPKTIGDWLGDKANGLEDSLVDYYKTMHGSSQKQQKQMPTDEDWQHTANKYGMTVQEVKHYLGGKYGAS